MSTRQEFFERVRAAAEGTPYAVTETTEGFDVTLDIVDAQWFGLFNKAGLRKVYDHHVKLSDNGAFSVTDESRSLEWAAGTPRLAATREVQRGRINEFGFQKVWAFDEHGNFGAQAEYRFNSEEGRDLIEGVAQQLGLQQRRGTEETIAIVFAAVALGGLAIGGIVVAILALLGEI
jgi:hypothetical protein